MSPTIPKNNIKYGHIVSNERREWWWIYTTHQCANTQTWQMIKKWGIFKRIHINWYDNYNAFVIHLRWLNLSTWVVPKKDDTISIFNFITQCASITSKNYFKSKVSAPISDNKKINSLSFGQGTPCQSNNGSKNATNVL
jgi:hypothetical protein